MCLPQEELRSLLGLRGVPEALFRGLTYRKCPTLGPHRGGEGRHQQTPQSSESSALDLWEEEGSKDLCFPGLRLFIFTMEALGNETHSVSVPGQ